MRGLEEFVYHHFGYLERNDSLSHGHDFEVFAALASSVFTVSCTAKHSTFIGCYSYADTRSANQNPSIFFLNDCRHLKCEIWIMTGQVLISSQINGVVIQRYQVVSYSILQPKTSMIRTHKNFLHIYNKNISKSI